MQAARGDGTSFFAWVLTALAVAGCASNRASTGRRADGAQPEHPILQLAAEPGPAETVLGKEYEHRGQKLVLGPLRTFRIETPSFWQDARGRAALTFKIADDQEEEFRRFTAEHIDLRLAIFVDGRIVMGPVVKTPLRGEVLIPFDDPNWTEDRVRDLARRILAQRDSTAR